MNTYYEITADELMDIDAGGKVVFDIKVNFHVEKQTGCQVFFLGEGELLLPFANFPDGQEN